MDAMAERARTGVLTDAQDVADTIEFLRVFVDRCHHTKEEELLFPAVRAAKIATAEETIVVLLAEHTRGREAVALISAAAERLANDRDRATTELANAMPGYTRLLRDHIRREESDCFDVADRELSDAVQVVLVEGYDRIEREVVGHGVHEAFHALLERLARTYLA